MATDKVSPLSSHAQFPAANNLDTCEIATEVLCRGPWVLSPHGYHSTAGSEVGEALASSTGHRAVRQFS